MSDYTIKEYDNLDSSANTINNAVSNMKTSLENGTSAFNSTFSDIGFKGPLAEHCTQVMGIINRATNNNLNNFSGNATTIQNINENYKETDNQVSSNVGGI